VIEAVPIELPKGTKAWRARIGSGIASAQMGAPPAPRALAGRVNMQGQPVLYLCLDRKTPIYEMRPSIGDVVTVQRFVTRRTYRICDLRRRHEPCNPFVEGDLGYEEYRATADRNQIRNQIGLQLAKPVSRGDEAAEYLPTQVFASFVREAGFDGLMFSSTQRAGGDNLVLFDPDAATARTRPREITIGAVELQLRKHPVRRKHTIAPAVI
jgi:hypothetical protein